MEQSSVKRARPPEFHQGSEQAEPEVSVPSFAEPVEQPPALVHQGRSDRVDGGAAEHTSPEEAGVGWLRLSSADEEILRTGSRAHVELGGEKDEEKRFVTVLRLRGQLKAFDSICYHAGGPLGLGDIEDVGEDGRACVRCPFHHYLVDLEDGRKWHRPLQKDASGKLVPAGWKASDAPVQRVHEVRELEGGIFVRLRVDGSCESDHWAHREDCFKPLRSQALLRPGGSRHGGAPCGADGGRPPSGHALRAPAGR